MSRIAQLIADLCPNGVEFKRLREVARIRNGRDFKHLGTGGIPVYGTGGVLTHVDVAAYSKPSVLIPRKGSLGNLYYVDVPFWTVDTIFYTEIFEDLIDPKYFYYLLASMHLEELNQAGGVPSLTQSVLNELRLPTPPLPIQREVVRVLDKFTQLEAELEARRRQYKHLAGRLLASAQDSETVRLGDVATVSRGASPRPIQSFFTLDDEGVPWIKIGDAPPGGKYITHTKQRVTTDGANKSRLVRPGDFVLSNSMSFGRPYITKIEGAIHDGWLAISEFGSSFVPDYLYYLLGSVPVQAEFARRAGSGTVQNLNVDIVKSIVLPLPPRREQLEVVTLLDRFDLLVNDLSSGLPAELHARRKQYEHYRDRLLTFREFAA